MQKITAILSALSTSFYLLAVLIGWLAIGVAMTHLPGTNDLFGPMNQELVRDWLVSDTNKDWRVLAWFFGFCLLNGLLFANLLFCAFIQLRKRAATCLQSRSGLLLVIHILVLLIMAGHFANMMVGSKQANIRLAPGDSRQLADGCTLRLESVRYTPPLRYLKMDRHKARHLLSRDVLDMDENYARVSLTRGAETLAAGPVYLLEPLKAGSLRVTLNRFYLAGQSSGARVGAILTFAVNPVHEAFFMLYGVFIGCLLLYLWKGPAC